MTAIVKDYGFAKHDTLLGTYLDYDCSIPLVNIDPKNVSFRIDVNIDAAGTYGGLVRWTNPSGEEYKIQKNHYYDRASSSWVAAFWYLKKYYDVGNFQILECTIGDPFPTSPFSTNEYKHFNYSIQNNIDILSVGCKSLTVTGDVTQCPNPSISFGVN